MGREDRNRRKYRRYDVSDARWVGGKVVQVDYPMHLTSLSFGGCGFVSGSLDSDLVPPKEIVCRLVIRDQDTDQEVIEQIVGNLVYLRPNVGSSVSTYHYGVKFHEEDRQKVSRVINRLELLARSGEVMSS